NDVAATVTERAQPDIKPRVQSGDDDLVRVDRCTYGGPVTGQNRREYLSVLRDVSANARDVPVERYSHRGRRYEPVDTIDERIAGSLERPNRPRLSIVVGATTARCVIPRSGDEVRAQQRYRHRVELRRPGSLRRGRRGRARGGRRGRARDSRQRRGRNGRRGRAFRAASAAASGEGERRRGHYHCCERVDTGVCRIPHLRTLSRSRWWLKASRACHLLRPDSGWFDSVVRRLFVAAPAAGRASCGGRSRAAGCGRAI